MCHQPSSRGSGRQATPWPSPQVGVVAKEGTCTHVLSPRAIVGDIWTIAISSSFVFTVAKPPFKIIRSLFDRFLKRSGKIILLSKVGGSSILQGGGIIFPRFYLSYQSDPDKRLHVRCVTCNWLGRPTPANLSSTGHEIKPHPAPPKRLLDLSVSSSKNY
jgi:hypothetical protein